MCTTLQSENALPNLTVCYSRELSVVEIERRNTIT